jgi:hypothetical protein
MSLLYTALLQRSKPNLSSASKIELVDRTSNTFRPSVSVKEFHLALIDDGDKADDNEFHLGPEDDGDKAVAGGDGDNGDGKFDVVVHARTDAEEVTTRDVSAPKVAVRGGSRTNTGRPPKSDSVKPSFQVDAFEALRIHETGMTLPTTGNNRKERKDTKEKKKKKTEKNARPQRNKEAANNNRVNAKEGGLPQVAWIMSFGGSVSETH